ncbi:PREDICTED: putative F-box/LRR-repeat protein 23 [Camelina sativa]|uniref:F-box/LRR-repeat protein 23 n=1 Tax=Camelina sativa TaxID=90675 RepID=A0ABM0W9B6_CAMSA|nr:PREDICTED: putative F-box/LRR-repeat protein 23 [Camelina sativa]
MTSEGLVNAIAKLPFLKTLEVSHSAFTQDLQAIGHAFPHLKTLKLDSPQLTRYICYRNKCDDDYPLEISESICPNYATSSLLGGSLTNTGLNAIVEGCPHLEHLDLRQCYNTNGRNS